MYIVNHEIRKTNKKQNTKHTTTTNSTGAECANRSVNVREDSDSNKIVKANSKYSVSSYDSARLKMKVLMADDSFDETSDSIIVTLEDNEKLSGVYVRPGYIEFSPKCNNNSFNLLSDMDSMFDLNWESSSHAWDGNDLTFSNENEIVIDYYFEPMLGMTHVLIEKMYLMERVIEFSCVWYDSYNDSDNLIVKIGTQGNGNAKDKVEQLELNYCTKEMFTTTEAPPDVKGSLNVKSTEFDCNFTCFECLSTVDVIQSNLLLSMFFGQDDLFSSSNSSNDTCSCPQQGNETIRVQEGDSVEASLPDGTTFEVYINNQSNNEIVIVINTWSETYLNETCKVTYYVNSGEFLNIQADTTIRISFILVTISMTDNQIYRLENAFERFFMNLFSVNETQVTVNISRLYDDEASWDTNDTSATTLRRRTLLQDTEDDEESYQVDIVVIGDSNDDASAVNLTEVLNALAGIAGNITGADVSITNVTADVPESGAAASTTDPEPPTFFEDVVDKLESLGTVGYIVVISSFVFVVCCSLGLCVLYAKHMTKLLFERKKAKPMLFHRVTADTTSTDQSSVGRESISTYSTIGKYKKAETTLDIFGMMTSDDFGEKDQFAFFNAKSQSYKSSDGALVPDMLHTHRADTLDEETMKYVHSPEGGGLDSGKKRLNSISGISGASSINRADFDESPRSQISPARKGSVGALANLKSGSKYSVPLSITDKSTGKSMVEDVVSTKQALEINYDDLEFLNQIGRGQFGSVYKAIWIEEEVAVKKIKDDLLEMQKELNAKAKHRMSKNDWHMYGTVMKNGTMHSTLPQGSTMHGSIMDVGGGTLHGSTTTPHVGAINISTMHSPVYSALNLKSDNSILSASEEESETNGTPRNGGSRHKPTLGSRDSNFSDISATSAMSGASLVSALGGNTRANLLNELAADNEKQEKIRDKLMEMRGEIILACSIPYHPNLIQVFGFVASPLCLVMDFMAGGSVEKFCYVNRKDPHKRKPTYHEVLIMLSKAANGMKFLAEYGLVHRDVAARNILLGKLNSLNRVDNSTSVKVTDFGMTRSLEMDANEETFLFGQKTRSNFGPLKWMAPESISKKLYSQQSDVYMFGITMWEIFHGKEPYPKMDPVNVAMQVAKRGLRPNMSQEMPIGFAKLMTDCWQQNNLQRPLFKQVHQSLRQLLKS